MWKSARSRVRSATGRGASRSRRKRHDPARGRVAGLDLFLPVRSKPRHPARDCYGSLRNLHERVQYERLETTTHASSRVASEASLEGWTHRLRRGQLRMTTRVSIEDHWYPLV